MRAGLTASTLAHAGVIVLALVSFTGAKPFDPVTESVPVDVVSMSDFTQMTKGTKSAPKADVPKQVAEKVDTPTKVEDPRLKVSDKAPVEATAPPTPSAPPPAPKMDQQQAPPKAAEPTPPKEQAEVALKNDPKKEKEEQPKDEQKVAAAPLPPRKPAPPAPPKPVETQEQKQQVLDEVAKLLDKRTPQRQAAAGAQVSNTGSLGSQTGTSATPSASVIDALKSRINSCWHPPPIPFDQNVAVVVNFKLKRDGTLAATPRHMGTQPATSAYGQAYAESGIRAIMQCAPYSFLPPAQYDLWSDIDFNFNTSDARQQSASR